MTAVFESPSAEVRPDPGSPDMTDTAEVPRHDDGSYDLPRAAAERILDISVEPAAISEQASAPPSWEGMVNQEHTDALAALMDEHGVSIPRGNVANYPNDADFQATFGLTNDEMAALDCYFGAGAQRINQYLRGVVANPAQYRRQTSTLLELFAGDKLPQSQGGEVVYRGMPLSDGPESIEGVEPSLFSATTDLSVAVGFAKSALRRDNSGYVVRGVLAPGIRHIPTGRGEKEVIAEPGVRTGPPLAFHPSGSESFNAIVGDLPPIFNASKVNGIVDVIIQPPSAQPVPASS